MTRDPGMPPLGWNFRLLRKQRREMTPEQWLRHKTYVRAGPILWPVLMVLDGTLSPPGDRNG